MRLPRVTGFLLLIAASAGWSAQAFAATCPDDSLLSGQLMRLAQEQGADAAQAVQRIEGTGRQLLALRSYVRSGDTLAARWSWSQAQIDVYRQSVEYRELLREIEAIRTHFESANPGFQLYANTEVRSLDLQIERWNENDTVGAIAADLQRDACAGLKTAPDQACPAGFPDPLATAIAAATCSPRPVAAWARPRDRLPGASGQPGRRPSRDGEDCRHLGGPGLGAEAPGCGQQCQLEVRGTAGDAERTLAFRVPALNS